MWGASLEATFCPPPITIYNNNLEYSKNICHLGFSKLGIFNAQLDAGWVSEESVTVPDVVNIGQTVADIWRFFDFFYDGGRPTSWICGAYFDTTHNEYLDVFIIWRILVGIQ